MNTSYFTCAAMALVPTLSHADDPCQPSREYIAHAATTIDISPGDMRATTGQFSVRRVPANKNLSAERFELRYLVKGHAVWHQVAAMPADTDGFEVRAAGKQLMYDFAYGAGGGIQCHWAFVMRSSEIGYRQIN